MRLVERRRLIKKTRAAVEAKVTQVVLTQLQSRYRSLKRELRKGNLRKRLRKFEKAVIPANPSPPPVQPGADGWQDWIDAFSAALTDALMEGADQIGSIENEIWASRGMPQYIVDPAKVVEAYQARTGRQITNIGQDTQDAVLQAISDWKNTDAGLPTLLEDLGQYFDESRAATIAATETAYATSEVALDQMQQYGINRFQWDGFDDWLQCLDCADLNGQIFDVGDDMPPLHPNCVLPGNEIVAKDILAATKSFYAGPVIELRTKNGHRLTVTPNHMILTPGGWVAAKSLCQGDHVICTTNANWIMQSVHPDYHYAPAAIEKIFSTLKENAGMVTGRVPSAPENFHGDGRHMNGNIEIVYTNRLLLSKGNASRTQPASHDILGGRDIFGIPLARLSAPDFLFQSDVPALDSDVGSRDLIESLIGGHPTPLGCFCLTVASDMDTTLDQNALDSIPLNSIFPGSSLFGHSANIISNSSPNVEPFRSDRVTQNSALFPASDFYSASHKSVLDHAKVSVRNAAKFVQRFSAFIAGDEIVEIGNFNYSGHVYDLQTSMGLYYCNGIITHNCRCGILMLNDNDEEI